MSSGKIEVGDSCYFGKRDVAPHRKKEKRSPRRRKGASDYIRCCLAAIGEKKEKV